MHRIKKLGLIFLFADLLSVTLAHSAPKSWQSNMKDLSAALSDTIPYLYPDPNMDSKELTQKVKRIYDITKRLDGKLDHSVEIPDHDPALPYIATLLREDIERAYQSLQGGHTDYAKGIVRNSVSYCIACHTRTEGGAQFPLLSAFEQPLKKASWVEKIEFQAASRQFDPAFTEVMNQLKGATKAEVNSLDLERASRIALAIAIRVMKDPAKALELAKAMANSPRSIHSMKEKGKVWQTDIKEWQKESGRKYTSEKDLMEAARSLVKKASGSEDYPIGGHTEVPFLRASVLMHDLLKQYPKSDQTGEALYKIGLSYDALRDLGVWSLHDMYFLACIKKVPHSKQSEQCYKKYEESVTLGFTGSSGIHIPPAVKKHLASVKQLAMSSK